MQPDVFVVFLPEILNGAQHRIGCCLTQTTDGRFLDGMPQFFEQFHIALTAFAPGNPLQNLQHTFGSDTTGHTFSTGLVLNEFHKEAGHVHHASIFVGTNQAPGTHNGPVLHQ